MISAGRLTCEQRLQPLTKATDMLNRISQENGELALLLIRRKMPLLGRRSVLDVANYGELQDLMACEPIQEMITKMWFGGLEPEGRWGPLFAAWLLPPIGTGIIFISLLGSTQHSDLIRIR